VGKGKGGGRKKRSAGEGALGEGGVQRNGVGSPVRTLTETRNEIREDGARGRTIKKNPLGGNFLTKKPPLGFKGKKWPDTSLSNSSNGEIK